MLVLTRKLNEKIIIECKGEAEAFKDKIEIQVTEIKGKQVKIGIKAPKNISISREEVYTSTKEN